MKGPGEIDWAGKLQSCQVIHMGGNSSYHLLDRMWENLLLGAEL